MEFNAAACDWMNKRSVTVETAISNVSVRSELPNPHPPEAKRVISKKEPLFEAEAEIPATNMKLIYKNIAHARGAIVRQISEG